MAQERKIERWDLLTYAESDAAEAYAARHGWGYSRKELTAMAKAHAAGDEHKKGIIQERLTAANYHKYSRALNNDDYEQFHAHMNDEYSDEKPTRGEKEFFGKYENTTRLSAAEDASARRLASQIRGNIATAAKGQVGG